VCGAEVARVLRLKVVVQLAEDARTHLPGFRV
jgi:hypothetical protein